MLLSRAEQGEKLSEITDSNFQFGVAWLSADVAEWCVESAPVVPKVCPGLPQASSGAEQDCAFLVHLKMLSKFIHSSVISAFLKALLRSLCAQAIEKKSAVLTLPWLLLLC